MFSKHISEKVFDGVVAAKGLDPKTMPKSLVGGRINFVRTGSGYYTGHRAPVGVGIKVFADDKFVSVVLKKPLEKKLTWEYDEDWFSRESEKFNVEGVDAKSVLIDTLNDCLESELVVKCKADLKAALDNMDTKLINKTLSGVCAGLNVGKTIFFNSFKK